MGVVSLDRYRAAAPAIAVILPEAFGVAEAWDAVMLALRSQLGEETFTSWCRRLQFERIERERLVLSAPTVFLANWNADHYEGAILGLARQSWPDLSSLRIISRGTAVNRMVAAPPIAAIALHLAPPVAISRRPGPPHSLASDFSFTRSPRDRRHTLATFQVGEANRAARAAVDDVLNAAIAKVPLPSNPLVIHGGTGLGKTHLLQALGQEIEAHPARRVHYLTADAFTANVRATVKAQDQAGLLEALRADAILIDDAQLLRGETVNAVLRNLLDQASADGVPVVLAFDKPPAEMAELSDRVRSRLVGGLSVEMRPFDIELRQLILEARIEDARAFRPDFTVPANVLRHVAEIVQGRGSDLQGAVNRLLAAHSSSVDGAPLSVATADVAIHDLVVARASKTILIETIKQVVAAHYDMSLVDLTSQRRTARVVLPRHIAMYLAKTMTLRSLPEIGRRFGGRDHTTVLHAWKTIEKRLLVDEDLCAVLSLLRSMIEAKS